MSTFPFKATLEEIISGPENYVDSVFSCLESEFLVMPKGHGFVEYPAFEGGYEALKIATKGFAEFEPAKVYPITISEPISIIVLRTMLGFTPPEWGYVTTQKTGVTVPQGFIRSLDRKIRMAPETQLSTNGVTKERVAAMVQTACQLLTKGTPEVNIDQLHRLIACIGGRGFGVRREDMRKMLLATMGKVFTAKTLAHLVECSQLKKFKTI